MTISEFFNCFCIFSCIGWFYECTYCSFKEGHWANRGFMFGPICPIYGVGTISCVFLFGVLPVHMGWISADEVTSIPLWIIFTVCSLGSAVLEYSTSYAMEKMFHAVWWDYSETPLNINGRICIPAMVGFGLAGMVVTRFVVPWVLSCQGMTNPNLSQFLALFFMFLFGMDMGLTVASLTELIQRMENFQKSFDDKMEDGWQAMASTLSFKDRYHIRNMVIFRGRSKRETEKVDQIGYYKRFRKWLGSHEIELRRKK